MTTTSRLPGEFHYRVPWRAGGLRPGRHRGRQGGGGFEFHGHVGLLGQPDPRRLDLRASLRDPSGGLRFRVYNQQSSLVVCALVDLSASMGFAGKPAALADFVAALGYSAYRSGDRFAAVGFDHAPRPDFVQPPTHDKTAGPALADRLRGHTPGGAGVGGALAVGPWLPRQRSLIFLLSDFHFPLDFLPRLLTALAPHAVVPVVFWQRREFADLPRFGLARLADPETGSQRTLLLRPQLRERIRQTFRARRRALAEVLTGHGCPPLWMPDRFDADAVTRYFYA